MGKTATITTLRGRRVSVGRERAGWARRVKELGVEEREEGE